MRNTNGSCIAIGNFDGIHVGHDVLIRRMIELSNATAQESIIITFKYVRNDLKKSSMNMKYINSPHTKLEILKSYNVDEVIEIELNEIVSKYSPEQFIKLLVDNYNVKNIVVGYNFTFGHKAIGNVNTLKEFQDKYGYRVEEILPVKYNGIAVSSTLVRTLLNEGKINEANTLLLNKYTINNNELNINYNKNIGFVDNKSSILVPPDGKYVVNLGRKEYIVNIVSNKIGASLIFDNKVDENMDIVFINKAF
ncbi:MAG: FAD synthetase family protein [Tissierellia bacterium]|jgi:riboflavin kinase/FMN adenylyltransferase|nr:FAD synthetase family protein [Tissierellia bacterium]MDD3226069.1 FAD synthetase family protein [Tissierellia bacterium]MDD3751473.1 FAD synthetase family protein [Tissierellia bacterium]MDD4045707.1 FAD synthetase family protein [Tissierellia bacterium]MDD4677644.1 FAD synthetase family protein [Tissierellia bacterium]